MFVSGTQKYPDINANFEKLKSMDLSYAKSHAVTSEDNMTFYGKDIHPDKLMEFLDYVSDMLVNNLFFQNKEEMAIENNNKLSHEIGTVLHEYEFKKLRGETKFNVIGSKENIKSFTPKQVRNFAQEHMSAKNCKIVLSGNIPEQDRKSIYDELNKTMGHFCYGPTKNFVEYTGNFDDFTEDVLLEILWEKNPGEQISYNDLENKLMSIRDIGKDTGKSSLIYHIFYGHKDMGDKTLNRLYTNTNKKDVYKLVAYMAKIVYKTQRDKKGAESLLDASKVSFVCDVFPEKELKQVWKNNLNDNEEIITLTTSKVDNATKKLQVDQVDRVPGKNNKGNEICH